ncbi:MAG: hypothetical protein PHS41_07060 [Victivallaceae bacterium]|nr:hypothetical protein [Victivallaceae bacterium]
MRFFPCFALFLLLCGGEKCVASALELANVFSDGCVLQREMPVPIHGYAARGEKIELTFADTRHTAVAGNDGRWRIELPAMPSGGPFQLSVKGASGKELVRKNIYVGEVWLSSGQSNMAWLLRKSAGGPAEAAKANDPLLRYYKPKIAYSYTPVHDNPGRWLRAVPGEAEDFSGVAYYFGKLLRKHLNVPVGILGCSYGGLGIAPFIPLEGWKRRPKENRMLIERLETRIPGTPANLRNIQKAEEVARKYIAALEESKLRHTEPPFPPEWPAEIRRPMYAGFHPLQDGATFHHAVTSALLPYAVRGTIWYQGEANIRNGLSYIDAMLDLTFGLRILCGKEMPFYYVQIAPFRHSRPETVPVVMEAQRRYQQHDKLARMAVINDVGDLRNIHPGDKQSVGVRLANLALRHTYGKTEIPADFPVCCRWEVQGNRMRLFFDNAQTLSTRSGKSPTLFEISGDDRRFYPAQARIVGGNQIELSHPSVPNPKSARFAWSCTVVPDLCNEHKLPVGIFHTGNPEAK